MSLPIEDVLGIKSYKKDPLRIEPLGRVLGDVIL
jgi:hypothetical protein